jgi:DNA invertase Pin-like site-specific DNA recombinase
MWLDQMAKDHPQVVIKTSDCFADSNSSAGRMMWHTLLMVSEMENEQRAERTQSGMQRLQEALQKSSHAVFGWFWNEDDGRMNPCWHQQAVIDHVHTAWNDNKGQSFSAISRDLNKWGVKTATGKQWTQSAVRRLVKAPAKMQDQLHQFTRPKRLISAPFRYYRPQGQ